MNNNYPSSILHPVLGRDQWTDCGVFQMVIPGGTSFIRQVVTPRRYISLASSSIEDPCPILEKAVTAPERTASLLAFRYHRYLHGGTVLARLVLAHWSVGNLRKGLRIATSMVSIIAISLPAMSLILGWRTLAYSVACLLISTTFIMCFALKEHATSISHGPSAIIILSGLCLFIVWNHEHPKRLLIAAALFGCVTAIFEFMDGGAPLGLAMVLAMSALASMDKNKAYTTNRNPQIGFAPALTYLIAVVAMFILKLVAVFTFYGKDATLTFARQLEYRVGDASWSVSLLLRALNKQLPIISPWNGVPLLPCIAASGVFAIFALYNMYRKSRSYRVPVALFTASFLVVPTWYLIFRNHSTVHAWFMIRMLAWPVALSVGLLGWLSLDFFQRSVTTKSSACRAL